MVLHHGKQQNSGNNPHLNPSNIGVKILFFMLIIQWALISFLLNREWHHHNDSISRSSKVDQFPLKKKTFKNTKNGIDNVHLLTEDISKAVSLSNRTSSISLNKNNNKKYKGVATTIFLNSPKWFQRRYANMVSNVFINLPPDWAIQIFYSPTSDQSKLALIYNPAIRALMKIHSDRILLTEIPQDLIKSFGLRRKKYYWTSEWIWQNLVADHVFIFSGNGAICTNAKSLSFLDGSALNLFQEVDYLGTPWYSHNGVGGSSSIFSYRNRTAMLDVIRYQPYSTLSNQPTEDEYVVQTMLKMNTNMTLNKNTSNFKKIATKEQTHLFSSVSTFNELSIEDIEANGPPLIIAGTLSQLDHAKRELVLEICPELKMIFPVLHNPNCFGAKPNGEECAKSICALKDPSERSSGC